MCVRNICQRCETHLDGPENLKLCTFYDLIPVSVRGLVCPNVRLSKEDARLCHGCAMSNSDGVGNLNFLATGASQSHDSSDQNPYLAIQQSNSWTHHHSPRPADEAGSLSFDVAGPSRAIPVCAPGDMRTIISDDDGNSPSETCIWNGVEHRLLCYNSRVS